MRAIRYDAPLATPYLTDLPRPTCPADGVVVEVRATGVCRSDRHAWQGHEPVPLPHVPGHEYAGVVGEVGPDVRRWQVGDRVTVPFVLGCGTCAHCTTGDAQVCPQQEQPGFTLPGSFAEAVAVPRADHNVVALPDDVSFVAAAALGCRFATAYRAVVTHGALRPGQWLAVFGCGGVGLSAVLVATALGARVVGVDVDPGALALAQALGAEATVATGGASERIRALSGGVHVGLDAIGDPAAVLASVDALRRRGRHVQVGLLHGDAAAVPLPMDRMIAEELTVVGSHGLAARDYPAMLDLARSVDLEGLVTRRIGLQDAPAALLTPAGPGITVIVVPG